MASQKHSVDYYALLALHLAATPAEIKAAYHRALLALHPDKHTPHKSANDVDIGLVKEAFQTLYTPALREDYDRRRNQHASQLNVRPAQVISLEDFEEAPNATWTHLCRCGGTYVVTDHMLDAGQHLLGCVSCSEVIWVGYEMAEEET